MRIYGLDVTSAPAKRKPTTCAVCWLHEGTLYVQGLQKLASFDDFEAWLHTPGPWLAALDFPFGLPRKLLIGLNWPQDWTGYLQQVASLSKREFEETLLNYMAGRQQGDKLHLRETDRLAGARSPMMLVRVPVAKMFFAGATRLLKAPISVLPCRPTEDTRLVVEGYPALVAAKLIGRQGYKSDERRKQDEARAEVRRVLVSLLRSEAIERWYGLRVLLSEGLEEQLVEDEMGDLLDAVLCAMQAGWVFTRRESGYGIPVDCDRDEGWIVDPALLR
jgi:hypothetical protein